MYSSLIIPSPIGDLIGVATDTHLVRLAFVENSLKLFEGADEETVHPSNKNEGRANTILTQVRQELSEYFEGKRNTFDIPLAPSGTDFQKQAWKALTSIPYGETRSYKEEATLAGNPKAVRAIGGANNKNPIVIIIPCHRVIGADGSLVGYAGGIERKKWLLEHEMNRE